MKKTLLVGLVLGLVLSVLQATVAYTKTTPLQCETSNTCSYDNVKFYKGWPLARAGTPGGSDSYTKPSANFMTFLNVPFITLGSIAAVELVNKGLKRLKFNKKSKTILLAGVLAGVVLGAGQIYQVGKEQRQSLPMDMSLITYTCEQKVPGCGFCPEAQKQGNLCTFPPVEREVRGWPLKHDTYTSLSRYDVAPHLMLNGLLFVTASTAITIVGLLYFKKSLR